MKRRALDPPPRTQGHALDADEFEALEGMARSLTASGWYRVVRKFQPRERYAVDDGSDKRLALYVDVETTGLDAARDRIIELGAVLFEYGVADGRIFAIRESYSAFEDPGRRIPAAVTRMTGIADQMVAGQRDARAGDAARRWRAAVRVVARIGKKADGQNLGDRQCVRGEGCAEGASLPLERWRRRPAQIVVYRDRDGQRGRRVGVAARECISGAAREYPRRGSVAARAARQALTGRSDSAALCLRCSICWTTIATLGSLQAMATSGDYRDRIVVDPQIRS